MLLSWQIPRIQHMLLFFFQFRPLQDLSVLLTDTHILHADAFFSSGVASRGSLLSKNSINFLQTLALGFDPEYSLSLLDFLLNEPPAPLPLQKQNKSGAYDEDKGDNIPSTVNDIHFPSDTSNTDGHDEHQKHTTIISARDPP